MVQHHLPAILLHLLGRRWRPSTPQDLIDRLRQERGVLGIRHEAIRHGDVKDTWMLLIVEAHIVRFRDICCRKRVILAGFGAAREKG